MKIFIGLTEIAGYHANLKRGFDELGVESIFVSLYDHPFKYGGDDTPNILVKLVKDVIKKRVSTPRSNLIIKIWWKALEVILKVLLFCWALLIYDVFIFGFNSSFWRFYDLPILKLLNKRIIYVFFGSDSRPPYINGYISRNLKIEDIIKLTSKMKARVKRIERYADAVISTPLYSHLHEKPIICFQLIGIPVKYDNINSSNIRPSDKHGIRVLHAPSKPECKGTPAIRQAIKNLQAKGFPIEFIEIIGKPHTEVLRELALCDLVVDQLYAEGVMAGFATEAAFLGKPAIVGAHTMDIWEIYSIDQIPPVYLCHNDEIEKAIEKLIVDEEYRLKLGRQAKQFIKSNWTPKKVAERYLRLIGGDIPENWVYDPKDIRYLHGIGLPESGVKELVRNVIEYRGKEALQLADKPELERMFVKFAYSGTT